MARNRLIDFIDGYENVKGERSSAALGKRFAALSYSGAITQGMRRRSESRAYRVWSEIVGRISYISTKACGAMLLSFGLVTIILSFLADYGSATGEAATLSFIIGVGFALMSIPLLLFDEPLSLLLQGVRILDHIFFEFLCINRVARVERPKSVSTVFASLFGVALALIGYFVPVWWVLFGFLGLVFAVLAMSSPEFSFFATLMSLPLFAALRYGAAALSALVVLTLISFLRKVFSGKRALVIEQYDFLLLLLAFAVTVSGIFNKGIGSFFDAMLAVTAFFSYVLASNIVTNRRLADCALNAVALSALPVCAGSVYELIDGSLSYGFAQALDRGVSSLFPDTGACAVFLAVATVFAAALAKQVRGIGRCLYCALSALCSAALLLTGEAFAVLALLLGVGVYFALKVRGWSALIIAALASVPYVAVLVPFATGADWLKYTSNSATVPALSEVWRLSVHVFADNAFFGIGMGEGSFESEMGGASVLNAQNLVLELGLEAGVLAVAAFLFMLAVRLRHRAVYRRYIKSSQVSVSSPMIAVASFAMVACGTINYVWSDMSVFILFWCVFGFGSATLRIAKRERDDRVLYYRDTGSHDSSVIDVQLG